MWGTTSAGGCDVVYRLFISHSSPSPDARQRLEFFIEELRRGVASGEQIEVLYDAEQILGGEDWRRRIAFMLHVCDGAVVLLDKAAVASRWVLAEATVVSLRHAWDERFVCVPVSFLDEPNLELAKKARSEERRRLGDSDWTVVDLPSVQFVEGSTPAEVAVAVLGVLRLAGVLDGAGTPADRLARQIQPRLADAPDDGLRELATLMRRSCPYLVPDDRRLAAYAIVHGMLSNASLCWVREQLDRFGAAFPVEDVLKILDLLSPLSLPAEASALLRRRRSSGGYAHASVCCEHPSFTVPRYVRRAHLANRPPTHFAISNTYGSFDELSANLRSQWRALQRPETDVWTDGEVDELLGGTHDVYVWVPGPVDDLVMQQLDRAYPHVAFIVHHVPRNEPTALPPNVTPLRPALTSDEEGRIRADYALATMQLDGWNS